MRTVCVDHIMEAIFATEGPHYYVRLLEDNSIELKVESEVEWCDICESEAAARVISLSRPLTTGVPKNGGLADASSVPPPPEWCVMCGRLVTMMALKNTGFCSERCRKDSVGEE